MVRNHEIHKNLNPSKFTNHMVIKYTLPDAESCEEHNAIQKKIVRWTAAKLWVLLCLSAVKNTEKDIRKMKGFSLFYCL